VDQGNHLKATNTCTRKCCKGGHQSLVTWCLDTVLVNSYLLSFHSPVPVKEKWTNQEKFRTAIIEECFALGKRARLKRKRSSSIILLPVLDPPLHTHTLEHRAYNQEYIVYKKEGVLKEVGQRRVLRPILGNKR
jgi:hypothetical protein